MHTLSVKNSGVKLGRYVDFAGFVEFIEQLCPAEAGLHIFFFRKIYLALSRSPSYPISQQCSVSVSPLVCLPAKLGVYLSAINISIPVPVSLISCHLVNDETTSLSHEVYPVESIPPISYRALPQTDVY